MASILMASCSRAPSEPPASCIGSAICARDIGTVEIVAGRPLEFKEEFDLKNCRSEPITIKQLKSSCGCLDATTSTYTLAPGKVARITATIRFVSAGERTEKVNVICDDGTIQECLVTATVVRAEEFRLVDGAVDLSGGHAEFRVVSLGRRSSNAPGAPILISGPTGVTWEFNGWKRLLPGVRSESLLGYWVGEVRISGQVDGLEDASMIIKFEDGTLGDIDLAGRCGMSVRRGQL